MIGLKGRFSSIVLLLSSGADNAPTPWGPIAYIYVCLLRQLACSVKKFKNCS